MDKPIHSLKLPVSDLVDVKQAHAESWNITHVGFGKNNENQHIAGQSHDAQCVVRYPAGSINPKAKDRPLGGLGFYATPKTIFPARDVELSYKFQFAASFDPAQGGKLPGLYLSEPGAHNTSSGSGGRSDDLHGSVRLMWRAKFQAEAYVYATAAQSSKAYADIPKSHFNPEYGDSLWRGILNFRKDDWNNVKIRARLNTPGQPDGFLSVSVNDTGVTFNEMAWRKCSAVVISALMFSTFYGGSSEKYQCPCDTSISFKDFELKKFAAC